MTSPTHGNRRTKNQSEQAPDQRRQACVDAAGGEPLMFVDGHDDAIMGFAEVDGDPRVVYDIEAIVRKLMRRDGMDRDGALEFFEYNIRDLRPGPDALWLFVQGLALAKPTMSQR